MPESQGGGRGYSVVSRNVEQRVCFPHNREWLEQNSVSLESEYVKHFSELAAELDMAIAVTLLEKHEPKPRNTVCLFDRHGKLVYRYSKVHIIRQRKLCKNILMMTEHVDNFGFAGMIEKQNTCFT